MTRTRCCGSTGTSVWTRSSSPVTTAAWSTHWIRAATSPLTPVCSVGACWCVRGRARQWHAVSVLMNAGPHTRIVPSFFAVVVDLSGSSPRAVSRIPRVVGVELAGGGDTVFYTTPDEHGRPCRVYRCIVRSISGTEWRRSVQWIRGYARLARPVWLGE